MMVSYPILAGGTSRYNDFIQYVNMFLIIWYYTSVLYALGILSYFRLPQLSAYHPSAPLILWHMGCSMMFSLGLIASEYIMTNENCISLGLYNQFFILSSLMWYLVLSIDLLIALVNPFSNTRVKTISYHIGVWSCSALSVYLLAISKQAGSSALDFCWIQHHSPTTTYTPLLLYNMVDIKWLLFYGPLLLTFTLSVSTLGAATCRFNRRQHDLTHRTKRRQLLQYLRYLMVFSICWGGAGVLYYMEYHHDMSQVHIKNAFCALSVLYPSLLLLAWGANTDLLYHIYDSQTSQAHVMDHVSATLRSDLMRYTRAGIVQGIRDGAESSPRDIYSEKKRFSTNVLFPQKESINATHAAHHRYYEKLGFTDYAPKVFRKLRSLRHKSNESYLSSFLQNNNTDHELKEQPSEGKSGMLFYYSPDKRYVVKTMSKEEHSFLLKILPSYHMHLRENPHSLLARFVGCHSIQMPFGWNRIFFAVMENIIFTPSIHERFDLKGNLSTPLSVQQEEVEGGSHSKVLLHDVDFIDRATTLKLSAMDRVDLLTQLSSDCTWLTGQNILDYSYLVGIRILSPCEIPIDTYTLPNNAVVSMDGKMVYYTGLLDILQEYSWRWKIQHWILSCLTDRKKLTAIPPPEYALRFLSFAHSHVLVDHERTRTTYGAI